MKHMEEFHRALGIVAVALGADYASGRVLAAFYAQTARASWLGVLMTGVVFGLVVGLLSHLARRNGTRCMAELLHRVSGGVGWGAVALYYAALLVAACMMLDRAGHAGALALPVENAALYAGGCALLFAVVLVFCGDVTVQTAGGGFLFCLLAFQLALLILGSLPDKLRMSGAVELRLRDSCGAALILTALHSAVCICLSAGTVVRFSGGRVRSAWLGIWCGGILAALLAVGNAVLRGGNDELLTLKIPFVALASSWGKGGFYVSLALEYSAAVMTLAGLGYGLIPKRKSPDFIEK